MGTQLFTDLNKAVSYAQVNEVERVVLISDGMIHNGTYTIPNGVTLLVPFDEIHTLCKTDPKDAAASEYKRPTFYSTLIISDGAKIEVENGGAISLGGTQANGYVGAPTGAVGHINMENNSEIILKEGANFICLGIL